MKVQPPPTLSFFLASGDTYPSCCAAKQMALMIFQNDKSRKARRAENGDDVRGVVKEKGTGYCLEHNTSDICTSGSVGPPPDLDK